MSVTTADFEILTTALDVTGLLPVVTDPDADLTIFAPTDDAFVKLAQDLGGDIADGDEDGALAFILATLDALDEEGDGLGLLSNILLYHVSEGAKDLDEVAAEGSIDTLVGLDFDVVGTTLEDKEPDVADPGLVLVNVQSDSSIIHVIDGVLIPTNIEGNEPTLTIAETVVELSSANGPDTNTGDFDILLAALQATGLDAVAADPDADLTVFAPTDAAFIQTLSDLGINLGPVNETGALNAILTIVDTLDPTGDGLDLLANVLLYHISDGSQSVAEIGVQGGADPLFGDPYAITDNGFIIDETPGAPNAQLVEGGTDLGASNGTIHVVDRVLIPVDLADLASDAFSFV